MGVPIKPKKSEKNWDNNLAVISTPNPTILVVPLLVYSYTF